MEGLNRCTLLGNLTADPELRFTQGGQAVLNIRMATNESYLDKDKNWKERTEFHGVVVWGKRAESLAKILTKGAPVFVEGPMRTSSYDDREGNKRYKTEVVAQTVRLLGRASGSAEGDGVSRSAGGGARPPRPITPELGGTDDNPLDDIPFGSSTPNRWGL
jgi:single-strand DNA-binding protein